MQTTDGNNNDNIPAFPSHQLSPILQNPRHESLSSQNSIKGNVPSQSPSQNSIKRHPSSLSLSSSQNSMNASHSAIPTTMTTTIMSNLASLPPKGPLCGPPLPTQLSSSSARIPWPLMPPQHQPPPYHQSPMIPYYHPMGVPPPFPPIPMPFLHDQFHSFHHHPLLLGNSNNYNAFNGQIYSRPWSTGLLDCFSDIKNCRFL